MLTSSMQLPLSLNKCKQWLAKPGVMPGIGIIKDIASFIINEPCLFFIILSIEFFLVCQDNI